MGKYAELGGLIGVIVDRKNEEYGDSVNKTGQLLEVLYPEGVSPEQYGSMMLVTRVLDKLSRIANGCQGDEDPWEDLAGYGIIGAEVARRGKC